MFENKNGIYLDYAATTPVSQRVFSAMRPYFSETFANPSSLHIPGQRAQAALDEARAEVAEMLEVSWKETYFTASATESINTVLRGAVTAARERGVESPHIITTNVEHSAVLETCRALAQEGVEVTYLPVDSQGLITAAQVRDALKEHTVLVSVMYVNNEIGTIQPIAEIASIIRNFRSTKRQAPHSKKIPSTAFQISNYPLFHSDAVQAASYLDVRPALLGVDLMTLSGHKMYGPKGVGLLYKRDGVDLAPLLRGGGQERGLRGGTENVPSIVGFAEALKETTELRESETERIRTLRDVFIERIEGAEGMLLNGSRTSRVANNVNLYIEGVDAELALPWLDARRIAASSGSACTARVPEPSHVIAALGREEAARQSIRFTLGRHTTQKDVETAAEAVIQLQREHR